MQNSTTALPRRIPVTTLVGCVLLCALGIALLILGLPEKNLLQKAMLQVSGLAFAAAVLFGVVRMKAFGYLFRKPTSNFRLTFAVGSVGIVIGITLYVISLFGPHHLAPLGQFFIWIALLPLFVYVATFDLRRQQEADRRTLTFSETDTPLDIISTKE